MKHRTGYLFKRGDNFYISWRVNGKPFTKALRDEKGDPITTKREAEEARVKLMAPFTVATEAAALESVVGKLAGRQAELAKFEDEQNPPLSLGQAWSEYLSSPNRPDSGEETLYQYRCQYSAFENWTKEKHPDVLTLRGVTSEIAEAYAAHLIQLKVSPNTYNKHLNLLTLVFRVLKQKSRLVENPWENIQRKRLITHSRRELTVDELKNVCQSAEGELRILLAVGVYSGLRLGDCATLRWAEVDLTRTLIRRIPNKSARRNPKPVLVPLHPVLRNMLSETPPAQRGGFVLPKTAALYESRLDAVTDQIQAHFTKCGIQVWKQGTGPGTTKRAVIEVGFHSLRHTFVSLCRESNAPLAVVESIVGHSNPSMTRHYTHVGEAAAGQAVAALPFVVGEAPAHSADPESDTTETLARIRSLLDTMTVKTWQKSRTEIVALLAKLSSVPGRAEKWR